MSNFFQDVIRADPRFKSVDRISALDLLEPTMRGKVQSILADAKAEGFDCMVFETYRSQARQQDLFEQGVTKLQKVGVHHYGLACDIVRRVNGQPSWDGEFSVIGRLARTYGLIWGGDWTTIVDEPHVQWCSLKRQAALFRGAWYPVAGYDPYAD